MTHPGGPAASSGAETTMVPIYLRPASSACRNLTYRASVSVSIFGGNAESIALWFKSIGHERWFYYYLTAVIAVSLLVYVGMRDTKRHSTLR